MTKDYEFCREVAATIWEQIKATAPLNVIFSWGISRKRYGFFKDEMPCLYIDVNGFEYAGTVAIAYNIGRDVYEIYTEDADTNKWTCNHNEVYCDEIGGVLDSIIERPTGLSDSDYRRKVNEFICTI